MQAPDESRAAGLLCVSTRTDFSRGKKPVRTAHPQVRTSKQCRENAGYQERLLKLHAAFSRRLGACLNHKPDILRARGAPPAFPIPSDVVPGCGVACQP